MPVTNITSEQQAISYLTSKFLEARDMRDKSTAPTRYDDLARAEALAIKKIEKSPYFSRMDALEKTRALFNIVAAAMSVCMQQDQANARHAMTQKTVAKQQQDVHPDTPRPKF